jgi:hypothetical protein
MAHAPETPDRNLFPEAQPGENYEGLRGVLDFSKPALPFNEAAKARIGKTIGDAVLPSRIRAPARRLAGKRDGAL